MKYKYLVVHATVNMLQPQLDEFAKAGWKAIFVGANASIIGQYIIIFEKPSTDDDAAVPAEQPQARRKQKVREDATADG